MDDGGNRVEYSGKELSDFFFVLRLGRAGAAVLEESIAVIRPAGDEAQGNLGPVAGRCASIEEVVAEVASGLEESSLGGVKKGHEHVVQGHIIPAVVHWAQSRTQRAARRWSGAHSTHAAPRQVHSRGRP